MGCNCVKSSNSRQDVSGILSNDDYKNSLVDYGEIALGKDFFSKKNCGEGGNSQFVGKLPVHKTIAKSKEEAIKLAYELDLPIGSITVIRYEEEGEIRLIVSISNMAGYSPLILG